MAPLAAASMAWAAEEPVVATAKPDRKIKLGLIGCGGRGAWLVDLFQKHGGYEIHAVADYFDDLADKAGERFGVDKTRRFSGLAGHKRLLDSGVEAAVVVNVPSFHPEHRHAAIEAGCHVYAANPSRLTSRPPQGAGRRQAGDAEETLLSGRLPAAHRPDQHRGRETSSRSGLDRWRASTASAFRRPGPNRR